MFKKYKQYKFLQEVYEKIDFFIERAGVPRTTSTLVKIIQEYELNTGEKYDASQDWHKLIGGQFYESANQNIDFIFEKFSSNQAAIFIISEYISHLANNGSLKSMGNDQEDAYEALKLLWQMCGYLASNPSHEETYSHAVIVPKEGKPFPEL